MSLPIAESRFPVGSSARIRSGSPTTARAIVARSYGGEVSDHDIADHDVFEAVHIVSAGGRLLAAAKLLLVDAFGPLIVEIII